MKNGYSKISSSNGSGFQKSRSMDFSSSSSTAAAAAVPPQNPKPSPPSRRKEGTSNSSSSASSSTTHHRGSRPEYEDEEPAADSRNKPPQVVPVVVKTQQQQLRHETELDHEWEGAGNGEKFGVILGRRSGSVSSSSASVMKRAFSMRRSSSVSERYCRIHDQQYVMAIASSPPLEEAETEADAGGIGTTTTTTTRSQKKLIIRRGANIFKACKRLLRL